MGSPCPLSWGCLPMDYSINRFEIINFIMLNRGVNYDQAAKIADTVLNHLFDDKKCMDILDKSYKHPVH